MKFNIVRLDKVLLIQTLYLHADPKGYGEHEYAQLLEVGEAVEGMSTEECKNILKQGARLRVGYLIDYYNGKPLKIEWNKISRHQTIMSSVPYDLIHGRFRCENSDPPDSIPKKNLANPYWACKENFRLSDDKKRVSEQKRHFSDS